MEQDPRLKERTDAMIEAIRKRYGFVPVVNQVLSERPDIFLPMADLSRAVLEEGEIDRKHRHLCAVSAAAAVGGEYCVEVQMRHATEAGATRDEVLEAIVIGSYMAMTRSQSYALRKYAANFDVRLERATCRKCNGVNPV